MSQHIYYNFSIINDSSANALANKTDYRLSPLIQNPSEYAISVLKFSLPTEAIQSFVNLNPADYQITYGSTACMQILDAPNDFFSFKSTNNLPLSNEYQYITYEDLVEAFNRRSMQTYRDYLAAYSSQYYGFYNVLSFSDIFDFNISSTPYTYEKTISVNSGVLNTVDNKLGYEKLTLNVGYTGSESGLSNSTKHPHRLFLVDPSGTKTLVYSSFDTKYSNTLVFEDCALQSLDKLEDFTKPIPSGQYQPKESFLKFNTVSSQFGNWKLRFESVGPESATQHNFHLNVSYNLELSFMPKQENNNNLGVTQFPVLLGFADNSDSLLQLKFHESFFYGNNYISLSPKLNNILGFASYLSSDGTYRIKLPQVLLSNTMTSSTFVDLTQPVSTVYKLNNIKSIQIRSSTIPVSGEYSAVSQTNILMSIDVSVDAKKDTYEFNSQLERFYDLIGNAPLSDVNFSIWIEYINGEVLQAYLPPYSSFTMLTKFVSKDKIAN